MSDRRLADGRGFSLVEALVALSLVASVATIASGAAVAMLELARAARAVSAYSTRHGSSQRMTPSTEMRAR